MDEGVYYYVESLLKQMSDSADRIKSMCQSIVGGGGSNIEQDWGIDPDKLEQDWGLNAGNGFTGV